MWVRMEMQDFWWRNVTGKNHWGDKDVDGGRGYRLDLRVLADGQVAGCCEHHYEPLGSIKY